MEPTGIGERLRSARQALGLSLEEVESATRIRRQYLEALELEAFDRIPGPVYVRGFLRTYGAHLGLAADELLQLYPVAPSETIVPQDSPVEVRIASATAGSRARWLLVGGSILLVGILIVAYIFYGELRQLASTSSQAPSPSITSSASAPQQGGAGGAAPKSGGAPPGPAGPAMPPSQAPPKPPAAAVTPAVPAGPVAAAPQTPPKPPFAGGTPPPPAGPATPSPQAPPKPPAPAGGTAPATTAPNVLAAPLKAEVMASARVWVRAVADGTTVFEGFLTPGDRQVWEATRELTLRVGNGGAIEVTVNGHAVGRLGDSGSVIDRTFTVGASVSP